MKKLFLEKNVALSLNGLNAFSLLVVLCAAASSASALLQVAGAVVINASRGETGFGQWGLIAGSSEAITVQLNAEGSAAPYLQFPRAVALKPGSATDVTYVRINASIPENYSGSPVLLAWLYATQEGEGGQAVKINIRVAKKTAILVTDLLGNTDYQKQIDAFSLGNPPVKATQEPTSTPKPSVEKTGGMIVGGGNEAGSGVPLGQQNAGESSSSSSSASPVQNPFVIAGLAVAVLVVLALAFLKLRKKKN